MRKKDYTESILAMVDKTLITESFFWQLGCVAICLLAAVLLNSAFKRIIFPYLFENTFKNSKNLSAFLKKYVIASFLNISAIVSLAIGLLVYSLLFKEATLLLVITLKLVSLFLMLRLLRISCDGNVITNFIGFLLTTIAILSIFTVLTPVSQYLDQFAIELGKLRISLYIAIKGIIILFVLVWISGLVSRKSKAYVNDNKRIEPGTKGIIIKIIDVTAYIVLFTASLRVFGVDMTTFTVIIGAIGVGIGFGLQKIASNFISGIILIFEKSIEVGDVVEIAGDIFGTIKHLGGRYTLLETMDGKEIMIPNEDFIISKVTNWTYSNNRCRITVHIRVAYDSNLDLAKKLMVDAAQEHPSCLHYPEIDCFLTEFGDFDVKFILNFWINDISSGRNGPRSDVMMKIFKKFAENNIRIPSLERVSKDSHILQDESYSI